MRSCHLITDWWSDNASAVIPHLPRGFQRSNWPYWPFKYVFGHQRNFDLVSLSLNDEFPDPKPSGYVRLRRRQKRPDLLLQTRPNFAIVGDEKPVKKRDFWGRLEVRSVTTCFLKWKYSNSVCYSGRVLWALRVRMWWKPGQGKDKHFHFLSTWLVRAKFLSTCLTRAKFLPTWLTRVISSGLSCRWKPRFWTKSWDKISSSWKSTDWVRPQPQSLKVRLTKILFVFLVWE